MVLQVRQYRIRWRVSPEGVGKLLCRNEQLGTILNHACSRRHSFIFFHCFSEKIRLDVSSESFSRQRIHMKKNTKKQALFSSKDKSQKLKCRLLHFIFGGLRVNIKHEKTFTAFQPYLYSWSSISNS